VTFQVGKWPALETSPLNRLLEDHCPRIHQEFGGRIFQKWQADVGRAEFVLGLQLGAFLDLLLLTSERALGGSDPS
jgi:hypothetical protein